MIHVPQIHSANQPIVQMACAQHAQISHSARTLFHKLVSMTSIVSGLCNVLMEFAKCLNIATMIVIVHMDKCVRILSAMNAIPQVTTTFAME